MIAQPAAAPRYLLELVNACMTNLIQMLISEGTSADQFVGRLDMLTILFCAYHVRAGQTVWYSQRGAPSGQHPPVSLSQGQSFAAVDFHCPHTVCSCYGAACDMQQVCIEPV